MRALRAALLDRVFIPLDKSIFDLLAEREGRFRIDCSPNSTLALGPLILNVLDDDSRSLLTRFGWVTVTEVSSKGDTLEAAKSAFSRLESEARGEITLEAGYRIPSLSSLLLIFSRSVGYNDNLVVAWLGFWALVKSADVLGPSSDASARGVFSKGREELKERGIEESKRSDRPKLVRRNLSKLLLSRMLEADEFPNEDIELRLACLCARND